MSSPRSATQYLSSVALVLSLVLLSAGVSLLTRRITEETLRVSIVRLLSGTDKPSVEIQRVRPDGGSSLSFSRVFSATFPNGKSARVFLVSVTGHSGPYPALFVRRAGSSASFAGIVGVAHPAEPWRYGLTNRVIESWADRVTAVADTYGDAK